MLNLVGKGETILPSFHYVLQSIVCGVHCTCVSPLNGIQLVFSIHLDECGCVWTCYNILYLFSCSTLESTLVQSIKRMWWRLQWCWSETISGLTFSRHLLFVVTMCYIACRWAVILAFDVRVEREAQEMADNLGVKIFTADIIYHLFDSFMKHREVSSATSEPLRGWFTMWCKD